MTRYAFLIGAITGLVVAVASISYAGSVKGSKSNNLRLAYDASLVSPTEAAAILNELETAHPGGNVNEAAVRAVLQKHLGGKYGSIQKLIIRPAAGPGQPTSIIILKDPADEAAAIAVSDPGVPADKSSVKGTKGSKK